MGLPSYAVPGALLSTIPAVAVGYFEATPLSAAYAASVPLGCALAYLLALIPALMLGSALNGLRQLAAGTYTDRATAPPELKEEYDFVVVGAGSAGALVAAELARSEGAPSVLLLEVLLWCSCAAPASAAASALSCA